MVLNDLSWQNVIEKWEKTVFEIDKVLRDRLFLLVIAAEKGWRVASDVAFFAKGDLADKNLAKAMKRDDKRKREEKAEKPVAKKKKPGFRGDYRPQFQYGGAPNYAQTWQSFLSAPPPPPPPLPPTGYPTSYGPRPETRSCINCNQKGHIIRNCPYKAAPSAALGAAPK